MNAGSYIGRIGGLAVALGVGAAVFTGTGVAYAEPTGSDSSTSGASDSGTSTAGGSDSDTTSTTDTTSESDTNESSTSEAEESEEAEEAEEAEDTGKKPRQGIWRDLFGGNKGDTTPTPDEKTSEPDSTDGETPSQSTGDTTDAEKAPRTGRHRLWSKPADETTTSASETDSDTSAEKVVAETQQTKTSLATVTVDEPQTASTASDESTTEDSAETTTTAVTTESAETTSSVSRPLATLVRNILDAFAGNSPWSPAAESPLSWLFAAASRREFSSAAADAEAQNPTMVLNGYHVVATGDPLFVGSFYGMFTNFPGFQGVVQGEQEFDLVDPDDGTVVGSFTGLVSQNNSIGFNKVYTEIVVTEVSDENLVGTEAGDLPPVGTVLASFGTGRYGTVYSAMPVEGGETVIKYNRVTRFGTFKIFTPYDAAHDLTDYVSFNRPIKTVDGFYLAPTEDNSAEMMSVTGFPPFFTAVQGKQIFSVYNDAGQEVGQFEGLVTVTSDVLGTYTEAVYVTETLSGNVGTAAGDTPPVGTVYNVIYFHSDNLYVIYSAKPDPGGNVISTIFVTPNGNKELDIDFDAVTPPDHDELVVPGEYTLVPVGEKQVIGINGLPPREAIIQSYQQFKVYDADGNLLGTVDADRTTQWDVDGDSTEAVLITNVTSGTPGTDDGDVPPVGSVFNFSYTGTTGFGQAYYALPGEDGARNKIVLKFVTPFGGIPLWTNYDAAKGLADYDYYNPFAQNLEMSALSAPLSASGASAGLLGASQMLCVLDSAEQCVTAA